MESSALKKEKPVCPYFGTCGGCQYQDVPYEAELSYKENQIRELLSGELNVAEEVFQPIVPSPQPYHYRNRVDLKFIKTREGKMLIGYTPKEGRGILEIEQCPIAMKAISDFIPRLKQEVADMCPPKYRRANLVVRCGETGDVHWGGIGRGSTDLKEEEYFSVTVNGREIHYSLNTFFQANLSILPEFFRRAEDAEVLTPETVLYDLYGGVGLFSIGFADAVKKSVLIESDKHSLKLAEYNKRFHGLDRLDIVPGRVEDCLADTLRADTSSRKTAFVDPPRAGLSEDALSHLAGSRQFQRICYLSCHPEALARDLRAFLSKGWSVRSVTPFDFFPQTRHLETFVVLE